MGTAYVNFFFGKWVLKWEAIADDSVLLRHARVRCVCREPLCKSKADDTGRNIGYSFSAFVNCEFIVF